MKKFPGILLSGLLLVLSACGTLDVASFWSDAGIMIDGRTDDWRDRLYAVEDTGVSFGVQNDDHFVYVCLRAADRRAAAQILRTGLIVWFDPKGGKDKILGVHYPLELDVNELPGFSGGAGAQDAGARRERRQALAERRDEIEILGPGRDESNRLKMEDLKGIEAAFTNAGGVFAYELKIPLAARPESPYAIGLSSGHLVGIGFDSPRPDILMGGRGAGGRMGGRGMGGAMIGGGGGRGGAEQLKAWLKVTLARAPSK